MKKLIYTLSLIWMMMACSPVEDGGEGSLQWSVGWNDAVKVATRALTQSETAALNQQASIRIYHNGKLVRRYAGTDEIPGRLTLMSGDYTLRVEAGDSVDADFDKRFYSGAVDFTIRKGATTQVAVEGRLRNAIVVPQFDASLSETFSRWKMEVKTQSGTSLVYEQQDHGKRGYFAQGRLTCTFKGILKQNGWEVSQTKTIDAEPGTEYRVKCVYTANEVGMEEVQVLTDPVGMPQPQNAGFEDTYMDGSTLRFATNYTDLWWDSGNKASAAMRVNVTTVDTSIKHSGNQSAKLASQWVGMLGIGKFAAGSIYTGEFLNTENTYYGILGFGRPFSARPVALKCWVKYTPGVVDYGGKQIQNGATDEGIIYVAVGDWQGTTYENRRWPVLVRTSGPQLFNPHDAGTIGYGERVFSQAVGIGNEMVEITIPLNYADFGGEREPKSIIIVASASRYGDYYEGSTKSMMWVDDFELVYE